MPPPPPKSLPLGYKRIPSQSLHPQSHWPLPLLPPSATIAVLVAQVLRSLFDQLAVALVAAEAVQGGGAGASSAGDGPAPADGSSKGEGGGGPADAAGAVTAGEGGSAEAAAELVQQVRGGFVRLRQAYGV